LQRLIEDLLRHGESEFQQTPLKLQPVKPIEIIAKVIDKQHLAMASRHIKLDRQVDDFVLRTDPEPIAYRV
jgi:K+-sensing histidine kinase KdpD